MLAEKQLCRKLPLNEAGLQEILHDYRQAALGGELPLHIRKGKRLV